MRKKYLLVSLLAASALLVGCSASEEPERPAEQSSNASVVSPEQSEIKTDSSSSKDSKEATSKPEDSKGDSSSSKDSKGNKKSPETDDTSVKDNADSKLSSDDDNATTANGESTADDENNNQVAGMSPEIINDGPVSGGATDRDDESAEITAEDFEKGEMDVVILPKSITENKDYVKVPFGKVSGSVIQSEGEIIALYDTFNTKEIKQWVKDLETTGWESYKHDTVDRKDSYSTFITKGDKAISVYVTDSNKKETVIAFSDFN